jgi:hypothetical protein
VSVWPEGMGAKEVAVMEHSAAKERLKSIREEERLRDRPTSSKLSTPIRDINSIVDDVQSNRPKDRYRNDESRDDRYGNRHQPRFDEQRRSDNRRR